MDPIIKFVPLGDNIPGDILEVEQIELLLARLRERLISLGFEWNDVSLLYVANSKVTRAKQQHDSDQNLTTGIATFCRKRGWCPSLIGSTVKSSFYGHGRVTNSDISDGVLFVAVISGVLDRIPVVSEITRRDGDRPQAGAHALRHALDATVREAPGALTPASVVASSTGLLFTSGSGHIEARKFIDFKECYAVGQELFAAANKLKAEIIGGCASNRTPSQSQALYYSECVDGDVSYHSSHRHGAVMTFLPYARAQIELDHPYKRVDIEKLDIEFDKHDQYAPGRYFYIRKINGRSPIEFLADYWDFSTKELNQMVAKHTAIPATAGAHLVTIASSLNRYEDNIWPNVPIWLDKIGGEVLLRLVRAEAEDGNYYLMELKPEYFRENARELMNIVQAGFGEDISTLAFLCESRKYVLEANTSNAEADEIIGSAPKNGPVIGIYLNGEYSTGEQKSIGYHNYSQIGAIIPDSSIDELPKRVWSIKRRMAVEIFISHAQRDRQFIDTFMEMVQSEVRGVHEFIDTEFLRGGDDFRKSIQEAIQTDGRLFAPFLSVTSVDSAWVKNELRWAIEQEWKTGRRVTLPVLMDDVLADLDDKWTEEEVAYVRDRLAIRITDYTEDGIRAAARKFAAGVKARLDPNA